MRLREDLLSISDIYQDSGTACFNQLSDRVPSSSLSAQGSGHRDNPGGNQMSSEASEQERDKNNVDGENENFENGKDDEAQEQLKKRNRKLLQKIQENIAKIEIKLEMN